MIREQAQAPIDGVELRGIEAARPTSQVLAVIANARAIVIGPSNPIVSIGPVLAVPGMREALSAAAAPVLAVSPVVGGSIVKGPTQAFMSCAGLPCTAQGVADCYGELLDGIVADEDVEGVALLRVDTEMADPARRAALARRTLAFAQELRDGRTKAQ
jgi:LPPG:FO 2-phospho-L-lactate transferase